MRALLRAAVALLLLSTLVLFGFSIGPPASKHDHSYHVAPAGDSRAQLVLTPRTPRTPPLAAQASRSEALPVDPSSLDSSWQRADDWVHVAVATDGLHDQSLVPLLTSLALNTKASSVFVHLFLTDNPRKPEHYRLWLACHGFLAPGATPAAGVTRKLTLEVLSFDANLVKDRIVVYTAVKEVGKLASPANYVRFFMPQLLPMLDKVIWLDCDTLVVADIAELWNLALVGAHADDMLAACPRSSVTYGTFFDDRVQGLFKARYSRSFDPAAPTYNAGVFVANLKAWRDTKVLREIFYWMEQQKRTKLWSFGTQPLQLLSFYKQWQQLPREWNVDGLGHDVSGGKQRLVSTGKVLHWSGSKKPWTSSAFAVYQSIWIQYNVTSDAAAACLRRVA